MAVKPFSFTRVRETGIWACFRIPRLLPPEYLLFVCFALLGLLGSCTPENSASTGNQQAIAFDVPEGFVVENLYNPAQNGKGSWVSLSRGRGSMVFAGDQFGAIYALRMHPGAKGLEIQSADSVPIPLTHAQGLLWHQDTLYISVNKRWEDAKDKSPGSGIYRAWDTDGDQLPDSWNSLLRLEGYGEHGPHSLVLTPDSSSMVLVAGNHTLVPERIKENSLIPTLWAEDQLLQPYPDPRGHAVDIRAPGGWIATYHFSDAAWQLLSAGYRNPFDLAYFDGELFTYDSDMEWDLGMPWYRPTRICHVTSGSEFGWRTGSGKWRASFPDNLPAAVSMLQGSPTALLAGTQLAFPQRYQQGLFASDWSFGTLYFVQLEPDGASYTGTRTPFMTGTPLPLADMIAGPDGFLYFVSGGRELQSGLYRLRPEVAVPPSATARASRIGTAGNDTQTQAAVYRSYCERYHTKTANPVALDSLWQGLSHADRFVRFAARTALEHQPVEAWAFRIRDEGHPDAVLQAGIALSRLGHDPLAREIHRAYNRFPWTALSERQQNDLVRALGLAFIRFPNTEETEKNRWQDYFRGRFPTGNPETDLGLAEMLVYLETPGAARMLLEHMEVVAARDRNTEPEVLGASTLARSEQYGPTITQLMASHPPREVIHYMKVLSRLPVGWTPELRREYYTKFYDVLASEGGMSFKAYMEKMRVASLEGLPESEVATYEELSGVYHPGDLLAELPQPVGPGQEYTVEKLTPYIWGDGLQDYTGTPDEGNRAFKAALCIACHRMRGAGGASGPDLSQIGSKFNGYDLINTILSPNDQISDQYANTLLELQDGSKRAGRIREENDSSLVLMPNPFDPGQVVHIDKSSIRKRGISPVSPMPPGLLNRLSEKEVKDLLVYLMASGDPEHSLYR